LRRINVLVLNAQNAINLLVQNAKILLMGVRSAKIWKIRCTANSLEGKESVSISVQTVDAKLKKKEDVLTCIVQFATILGVGVVDFHLTHGSIQSQ
jgi:hypothetical protein